MDQSCLEFKLVKGFISMTKLYNVKGGILGQAPVLATMVIVTLMAAYYKILS